MQGVRRVGLKLLATVESSEDCLLCLSRNLPRRGVWVLSSGSYESSVFVGKEGKVGRGVWVVSSGFVGVVRVYREGRESRPRRVGCVVRLCRSRPSMLVWSP